MEQYLDSFNPTIEEVRRWGYEEDMYFIEQDEDLVLHSAEYISILMELSSDANCPKNMYCLSILTHFSQIQLANRKLSMIEDIYHHVNQYIKTTSIPVEKWKFDFLQLRELIIDPRSITEEQSDAIAFKLTVGDYNHREFKKLRILPSGFIEYLASTSSYKEYFYINPHTSFWKSSRYFPSSDMGLEDL
ncbi:hypothetical protein [Puia dinghuensis]|uniref:Uncharacterized protein n=1 Tax=Puia dinghuensis TaxID=1792502 RepID=A0A8J2UGQ9_9BACT|nr:hypothetical protein [Puia dinghuensis]GGB14537.1 hypothetical protein GCM10011511_42980 [Puia dinghuensis]